MAEEIKDLIEKINQEGFQAAEKKAQEMEVQAKHRAQEIVAHAESQAKELMDSAKEGIARDESRAKALLAQAGRDLLLGVRKEIESIFQAIIAMDVRMALTPEVLSNILSRLVLDVGVSAGQDIVIGLKDEDREVLEKTFFARLKEETRRGITLRSANEITGGFTISYDSGRSQYEFTDKALAEYIGNGLKPKLKQILSEALLGQGK